MGYHYHKALLCNLFQKLHNLNAGIRVQGPGRFIREKNLRVIDQGTGNGYSLHLSAGHLTGTLVKLGAKPHFLKSFFGPAPSLVFGNTGNGQGKLHIGQHSLMGNQVIALKNKANGVISVGIPIPVLIFPGGNSIDDQVSAVVTVQATDNIQKSGLAGTTWT